MILRLFITPSRCCLLCNQLICADQEDIVSWHEWCSSWLPLFTGWINSWMCIADFLNVLLLSLLSFRSGPDSNHCVAPSGLPQIPFSCAGESEWVSLLAASVIQPGLSTCFTYPGSNGPLVNYLRSTIRDQQPAGWLPWLVLILIIWLCGVSPSTRRRPITRDKSRGPVSPGWNPPRLRILSWLQQPYLLFRFWVWMKNTWKMMTLFSISLRTKFSLAQKQLLTAIAAISLDTLLVN